MRYFPYGKAAFSFLLFALLSGGWILRYPPENKKATLTMWVFAKPHAAAYAKAIPEFEKAHPGVTVNIQIVDNQALANRLQAAFVADLDVPDLVEIEISQAGTFFRGPISDVGFTDLTERVHQSGLWEEMVQARFAPYMDRGHIFGLPHDVHPVQFAYRRDIFEQVGIDVNQIKTWDDFIAVGRKLTIPGKRYMAELNDGDASHLELCLFQRGGGYFDQEGNCIFDSEISVQTMLFYVPLVAGDKKIANSLGSGQILTKAVEDGYLLCLVCPDWRSKSLEIDIPRMSGKMALMSLPAVTPGGARTSTWGGTMLGITKHCKNQDLAWELAKELYLNKEKLAERFAESNILPAVRSAWALPAFHAPNAYYSGQKLGETYLNLAPDVPFQYTSPFIQTAKSKLSEALVASIQYYNSRGKDGFEAFVRQSLKESADQVRALVARNPY